MTLHEKLNVLTELENANLNPDTIESIVESMEHPETLKSYNSVEELWKDVLGDSDEEA